MKRALLFVLLVSCGPRHRSAEDRGRLVFESTKSSNGVSNAFSCATCHTKGPGGSLEGVTTRVSFWGGQRRDLLSSINDCRLSFMDARTPWTSDDDRAKDLYAYLASTKGPKEVPFTTTFDTPLPSGDTRRGEPIYVHSCRDCHGALHDGAARIATFVPILPDEPELAHTGESPADLRVAFRRKVREGAFASRTGSMPPFSRESLSDQELADLLAYLIP